MTQTDRVLAMGFFDGVHCGHKVLLETTVRRAVEQERIPSVLSFDIHPDTLLSHHESELIYGEEKRKQILADEFGITDIIRLHFDEAMMRTPWEDFLRFLIEEHQVKWFVVGYDFRFGHKGEGTAEKIEVFCRETGLGCDIIPPVELDGEVVRSNSIRGCIRNGEIERANRLLGRNFSLEGVVGSGYHIGSKIGFPTVNLQIPAGQIVPRFGVYATKVRLGEKEYPSVTNVGTRPTFSDDPSVTVETYILDFAEDLYGKAVEILFAAFLRPEKKFPNAEALTEQIRKDVAAASAILGNTEE